jgi:phosphoglycerol transferase MdoB-like AlkP superfamily enzyme
VTLPPRLRLGLLVLAILLVLMTVLRFVFWVSFHGSDSPVPFATLLKAYFIGFRFDLRLALVLMLPWLALSFVPALNPERSAWARRFWAGHLAFQTCFIVFFYSFDLGHYEYLETRIDVSSLRFLLNPIISFQMMWETYPIGWSFLGLIAFGVALNFFLRRAVTRTFDRKITLERRRRILVIGVTVVVYVVGLWGKASWYPLRWSDAFFTTHRFTSDLTLNPLLYFMDTACTAEDEQFDEEKTRQHYAAVAAYLGVDDPDRERLTFDRRIRPKPFGEGRPNVVVVLMESFAAHTTGIFGNPLRPSPHFDAAARQGLLWRRFYTPRFGTARAVFATFTGIPDTITRRTASRNPQIVNQYTIPGALEGYETFYFLGGSANWANIRGLLAHNIDGLQIHEEGSYPEAPRIDVWGISDLHLFEEANKVLRHVEGPFFAFVHLSGNHRPYTIPDDNRGFELDSVPEETLQANGFHSLAEYNSFRFLDHSIGFFLKAARAEAYFENTLFFFLGDNGTPGKVAALPPAEEVFGLGMYHTPFLIYGPGLIREPRVIDLPATQMDVMPTVAGAIGAEVLNTTLGRNLLDERFADGYAFIQARRGALTEVGLLGRDYYLIVNADGTQPRLHAYASASPTDDLAAEEPERVRSMTDLGLGLFYTSKWMMYKNTPR